MEYNDYQILENYENMAKAYSTSLAEKGFVFVNLDNTNSSDTLINKVANNLNKLWKIYLEGSLSRSFTKNKVIYAQLAQNTSVIIDNYKNLFPNAKFDTLLPLKTRPQDIPKVAILLLTDLIKDIWTLSTTETNNQSALLNMANDLLLQIKTLAYTL